MSEYFTGAQILSGDVEIVCEDCHYSPSPNEDCWRLEPSPDGTRRTLACYCPNCGKKIGALEPVAEAT